MCQDDGVSFQLFDNQVCEGNSIMNQTMAMGICSDTPPPDDGDKQLHYGCVCGLAPPHVTMTASQPCAPSELLQSKGELLPAGRSPKQGGPDTRLGLAEAQASQTGAESGEQVLQHRSANSSHFWFVNRAPCGDDIGTPGSRVWAGQCQPAKWNRSLSVVYTCHSATDSISFQAFENQVCEGTSIMNHTMDAGMCSDTPRPDDGDKQVHYSCVCGVGPPYVTLRAQPC
jgi:hypothetical protein